LHWDGLEVILGKLTIQIEQRPAAAVVKLAGEAGQEEADDLAKQLQSVLDAPTNLVVLDLSDLAYIASLGIGPLVSFRNEMTRQGRRVVITAPPSLVRETLRRASLQRIFGIYSTLEEALSEPIRAST
jgi:anti-sigma B factor antagonist